MNIPPQTRNLILAGIDIVLAWIGFFACMFASFYGFMPQQTATPVFQFTTSCVFPYGTLTLAETAKATLTIAHWVFSILVFVLVGSKLPAPWRFVVALISIPLLGLLGRVALHLSGF